MSGSDEGDEFPDKRQRNPPERYVPLAPRSSQTKRERMKRARDADAREAARATRTERLLDRLAPGKFELQIEGLPPDTPNTVAIVRYGDGLPLRIRKAIMALLLGDDKLIDPDDDCWQVSLNTKRAARPSLSSAAVVSRPIDSLTFTPFLSFSSITSPCRRNRTSRSCSTRS
jgi:hypothetical protein